MRRFDAKLHAITDGDGLPVALPLTPGQQHDLGLAGDLLEAVPNIAILVADKAYDTNSFIAGMSARDIWPNIPNRSKRKENRRFFPSLYMLGFAIERFVHKIKHFRRITARHEKPSDNYLALCQLASARIILRGLRVRLPKSLPQYRICVQFRFTMGCSALPKGI